MRTDESIAAALDDPADLRPLLLAATDAELSAIRDALPANGTLRNADGCRRKWNG